MQSDMTISTISSQMCACSLASAACTKSSARLASSFSLVSSFLFIPTPTPPQFGQLREVHIKQGFAFIDYAQPESAQDAIREMHGKRFFGRILKVQVAGEGTSSRGLDGRGERVVMHAGRSACSSLFVANIEASITEGELSAHFAKFGRVVTVKLLPRKAETLSAFVDFERVEDAATAHESKNVLRDLVLRTDYSTRDRGPLPNSHRFDDRPPRPPAHYYDDHGYMPGPPLRHDDRRPSYYGRYDERDRQYDRRTDYPHPAYGRHDARRFEYGPPPGYERDVPLRRYDGYDGYDRAPPMRERDYYDERRCASLPATLHPNLGTSASALVTCGTE